MDSFCFRFVVSCPNDVLPNLSSVGNFLVKFVPLWTKLGELMTLKEVRCCGLSAGIILLQWTFFINVRVFLKLPSSLSRSFVA